MTSSGGGIPTDRSAGGFPTERVAKALRLHGDLDTRANADYLAKAAIAALDFSVQTRQFDETGRANRQQRLVGPWVSVREEQ